MFEFIPVSYRDTFDVPVEELYVLNNGVFAKLLTCESVSPGETLFKKVNVNWIRTIGNIKPENEQRVLVVNMQKDVVETTFIDGEFIRDEEKVQALYWMPMPSAPA